MKGTLKNVFHVRKKLKNLDKNCFEFLFLLLSKSQAFLFQEDLLLLYFRIIFLTVADSLNR